MASSAAELFGRVPLRKWVTHSRLILAAKTALAVGLAWLIAPLVPGVAEQYPYYAPLGALVSMTATLMSSVRTGLGTLLGLAIGIVLAGGVIVLWYPNVFSISLVVGIGVLIAGNRWFKAGGDYVPTAALFVLIIGGQNADNYSIGYLVQMAVGITVGLVVNFLIYPPLTVTSAVLRLTEFRELLARHLNEMSEALIENWPPEHEDWASRTDLLRTTSDGVRQALHDADESAKANPRARAHKRNLGVGHTDLLALETVTFHVRDLTEVLAASIWERGFEAELPVEMRIPVSDVLKTVATALLSRNSGEVDGEAYAAADEALSTLLARIDEQSSPASSTLSTASAIAMNARRILASLEPEKDTTLEASDPTPSDSDT